MDRRNLAQIRQTLKEALQGIRWFSINYLIPFLEESLQFIQKIFETAIDSFKSTDHGYHSTFSSSDELLSTANTGFCLDGDRRLSAEHSFRSALICGSTGMGKSTVVAVPSICTTDGSFLINDPSGELLICCGNELLRQDVEVKVIDLARPERSSGFNILTYCRSQSDMQKIANMLVRSKLGSNSNDPFWQIQAENTIQIAMQVACAQGEEMRTMANVYHIVRSLSTNTKLVDRLVGLTNNLQLIESYKAFISMDVKLQTSIQATALSALQVFSNPAVAKVTAVNTIDLSMLRNKRCAIFLQSNTMDMKYYSSLISIIFEMFVKEVMAELPQANWKPVYIILDECSSLYLPTLSITLANCRKYKCGIMLLLQAYEQLVNIYGRQDAESMRGNTFTKMSMGAGSHASNVEISSILGKYSWEDPKTGKSGVRELLTAQQVREISTNQAVLICSNHPPMLLNLRPYYKNPFLRLKTQVPFTDFKGELPAGDPPLSSL